MNDIVHSLSAEVYLAEHPVAAKGATVPVQNSPACYRNGALLARCPKKEGDDEEGDRMMSIAESVSAFVYRN